MKKANLTVDVFSYVVSLVRPWGGGATAVGSTQTVSPTPKNADYDILVFCPTDARQSILESIWMAGFTEDSGDKYKLSDFNSYRFSHVNIILTHKMDFYERFVLANDVLKRLNLKERDDRVLVSSAILYNQLPQGS